MKSRKEITEDKKEPEFEDNVFGPASRFGWKVLAVLIVFAIILWLWRLFN
ncbi:hypothetical protein [uncultured Roseivirga sp.]|tara:strand:- start:119249 stop:119398 length:150 start_codon:yes stop_codon:yes gene_type:complete